MENRSQSIWKIITIPLAIVIIILLITKPNNNVTPQIDICNEDSLKTEIFQLQNELNVEEDGWDLKESRYEDILFEYEYGLNHLKNSHPEAYREFHRIIGYKERYDRETERNNKKRLKLNKW